MENFSLPNFLLLLGLLFAAGIILIQTAKKRKLHDQHHRAAWLERLKIHKDTNQEVERNPQELINHIKNLTNESNALLNQLEQDKKKDSH